MKIYIETEMTELPKRQRRNEMNEQVKEIRKVVADSLYAHYVKTWDDPDPLDIPLIEEEADGAAEALWKAGYRKQSETVKEFAQKAISRVFEGITQRFCDCYNDGLLRGYPDSELSRNFLRAFDECKDIAEKEINDLAEQYGREVE